MNDLFKLEISEDLLLKLKEMEKILAGIDIPDVSIDGGVSNVIYAKEGCNNCDQTCGLSCTSACSFSCVSGCFNGCGNQLNLYCTSK